MPQELTTTCLYTQLRGFVRGTKCISENIFSESNQNRPQNS